MTRVVVSSLPFTTSPSPSFFYTILTRLSPTFPHNFCILDNVGFEAEKRNLSVMAESSSPLNPDLTSNPSRKRRKTGPEPPSQFPAEPAPLRWRTDAERQIYSSKLVDALRHLRRPAESPATTGIAIRDAADRALAASAKGKTRWSRAILTGRLKLRLTHINRKHKKAGRSAAESRPNKPAVQKQKKLPPLQRKLKVLSRLVPGCRKLPLPNLLEETTDYVAALEMQVKAMALLTGLLNVGSSAGAATANGV